MSTIERSVPSASILRNGIRLAARLIMPAGRAPFPCVVFVHGLGSSKDSPRNVVIAEHLADAGIAAILFDLSGHGESGLDARAFDAYVDDVAAVFDWATGQRELRSDGLGAAGSSLGATVVIEAIRAGRINPAAAVLRAPPLDERGFAGIRVPTLVIVGSRDPLREAIEHATARKLVEVDVVDGATHLFEEPGTLERALEATVAWFTRHLATRPGVTGMEVRNV